MKYGRRFLRLMDDRAGNLRTLPFLPIIEIAGDHRILIENHHGVIQYSDSKIGIRITYGEAYICGCGLRLRHMTKVKLLITGRIDQISISRRNQN